MVITIIDNTRHCFSNADGDIIFSLIYPKISKKEKITVSFKGIEGVSSSFINSAFVPLLEESDFKTIKKLLCITNSTKQINDMIKKCFHIKLDAKKISA